MLRQLILAACAFTMTSAAQSQAQTYRPGVVPGFRAGFQFLSQGVAGSCPNASLAYYDFQADTGCSAGVNTANSVANLTVSRASIGYDLAATTQFAANVARRTGAGLLVEPAATNVVTNSNTPTAWFSNNGIAAASGVVCPDGTSQAYRATISANPSFVGPRVSWTSGANGSTSFFFKSSPTSPAPKTRLSSTNTQAFNTGFTSPDVTITTGWQRASFTGVLETGSASLDAGFGSRNAAGADGGSGYYGSIDFCFGQVETGGPTSYIPTTTAAATRAADNITLTLPTGTTKVDLAYDNSATNTITVSAGSYTIPANPAGTNLKSLRAY